MSSDTSAEQLKCILCKFPVILSTSFVCVSEDGERWLGAVGPLEDLN